MVVVLVLYLYKVKHLLLELAASNKTLIRKRKCFTIQQIVNLVYRNVLLNGRFPLQQVPPSENVKL